MHILPKCVRPLRKSFFVEIQNKFLHRCVHGIRPLRVVDIYAQQAGCKITPNLKLVLVSSEFTTSETKAAPYKESFALQSSAEHKAHKVKL